jgi:DNA-binding NtrC family response regulator
MGSKIVERKFHILHLEDDASDAEYFRRVLAEADIVCHITLVQTYESFLKALNQMQFDLIVSDFSIPMPAGKTALKIAGEKCPKTPFIFVSGTLDHTGAAKGLILGAAEYVPKRNTAGLILAVRRALRRLEEE